MQNKNNTLGYIIVIVLLTVTSVFSLRLFFQQRSAHDRLDIRTFPYKVGNWQGKDLKVSEKEYDILETRNLVLREYANPSGEKLSVFIIYSETNRAVFHPPEVCLIGSSVKIVDKKTEKVDSGEYKFSVNRLDTEKDNYRGVVLYCYKAGNLYTDNFYLQQASFALNQLLGRHKGGATIRVSMPIRENKNKAAALNTLKNFIAEAAKIIDALQ